MRLLFSVSLATLLGFVVPARAELQCKCDHLPIQPKECVNLCFGVLLSNLSPEQMESVLGLDAQLRNDIAAIRNEGPIESISDLRLQLANGAFERLESKIEAAASGRSQPTALREQLAAIGTVTDNPELTDVQIAALDDEAESEVAPDFDADIGTYDDADALPDTASGIPLLALIGGLALATSLALRGFRKRSPPDA